VLLFLIACQAASWLQAQDSYEPDEILIVLRSGVSIDTVNARFRTRVLDYIPETRLYRLALPEGSDVRATLVQMYALRYVDGGEPNYTITTPEPVEADQSTIAFIDGSKMEFVDRSLPSSYFSQSALTQVNAAGAHQLATGRDVVVAVIDTGITFDHPALASRITKPYYDFVDDDDDPIDEPGGEGYGHGTFVAGLIALLAPDAAIMPLRALDADGQGNVFNIAKAIYFAVNNGARVINMSFGMDRPSEFIRRAIDYACHDSPNTVALVASAGNDNRRDPPQYPAWDANVFAVAAVDDQDIKAEFSNYGWHISFSAPGVNIYSTYPKTDGADNDGFAWWSGTSFAAPFVAAQVALDFERFPNLRFRELRDLMHDYYRLSHRIDGRNPDYLGQLGRGRIDLELGVR
jgi:subtilisin family serine protease